MALAMAGLSFMLTVIWGEPLLRVLRHLKIGETIRLDGPQRHISKLGTPTLGGVLFILPVLLITVLFNAASLLGLTMLGRSIFLPMGTMVVYGILGSFDDWKKLRGKRADERGMRARTKFIIQIVLGIIIAAGLQYVLQAPQVVLPWLETEFSLGVWYIPLAALLIVGFSNAVNFTDGLDGLAGLISATCFAAFDDCPAQADYLALLYPGGCNIWLSCPTSTRRQRSGDVGALPLRAFSRCPHDRAMDFTPDYRSNPPQRNVQCYFSGRLLQAHPRKAIIQDGSPPSPF
jgi:hypothetical protein